MRSHQQPQRKSIEDSVDTISRGDTISLSIHDSTGSPWKDESVSCAHKAQSQSVTSSKQSPSQDSDVWHSESEANWTMVDKDITQSQILSEDEPKQIVNSSHPLSPAVNNTVSHEGGAATTNDIIHLDSDSPMGTNCIPDTTYGFETPRAMEIFGAGSWNTLCLAMNFNFLLVTKGKYEYHNVTAVLFHITI